MRTFLARKDAEVPDGGFVAELLQGQRRRDIVPNRSEKSYKEQTSEDIAAMVIQATGEKVQTCSRCRSGLGPFIGCFAIPRTAFGPARVKYTSCANCVYHGNHDECSLKTSIPNRNQPPVNGSKEQPRRSESATANHEDYTPANDSRSLREPSAKRRCTGRSENSSEHSEPQELPNGQELTKFISSYAVNPIYAGQCSAADQLEMEDWEMAPGWIRENAGDNPQSKSGIPSHDTGAKISTTDQL